MTPDSGPRLMAWHLVPKRVLTWGVSVRWRNKPQKAFYSTLLPKAQVRRSQLWLLLFPPWVCIRYQTYDPSYYGSKSPNPDSFWIFSLTHTQPTQTVLGVLGSESFHTLADKHTMSRAPSCLLILTATFSVPVSRDAPHCLNSLLMISSAPGRMRSGPLWHHKSCTLNTSPIQSQQPGH